MNPFKFKALHQILAFDAQMKNTAPNHRNQPFMLGLIWMLVASLGNTRLFFIFPAAAPAPLLMYLKHRIMYLRTPLALERRTRRRKAERRRMKVAVAAAMRTAGASLQGKKCDKTSEISNYGETAKK